MPKAYWIARVDVEDGEGVQETYKRYIDGAAPVFERNGARFLVRGGTMEVMEGGSRARNVVVEFPSLDAARTCFNDPDYQAARDHRTKVSEADIIIVEGLE